MERPPYIVTSSTLPEEEDAYPAPFDAEKLCLARNLGKATGTKSLGVWELRLLPGRRSSFTHAHSAEEEFVYVLRGQCNVRIIEQGQEPKEFTVNAGDAIAFPPGTGIAHCVVNRSSVDCVLLCFGDRRSNDTFFYAEDAEYNAHLSKTRPEVYWDFKK
jgi:uncharacterized cupin superfamily protein